jgi:hypothetical protein
MRLTVLFSLLLMASSALAQTGSSARTDSGPVYAMESIPQPVSTIEHHHSSPIQIDFEGTWLLPKAHGEAQISTVSGAMRIEIQLKGLSPASDLGPAYLTYVLWAAGPGGTFHNLGEVVVKGSTGVVAATTEMSSFALLITAEPYFAVTEPSDAIVLRNTAPQGNLRYKIAPDVLPLLRDRETPLDLVEARNAVRIARRTGAERLAPDALQRAVGLLSEAERRYHADDRLQTIIKAREATEAAEAARRIAMTGALE